MASSRKRKNTPKRVAETLYKLFRIVTGYGRNLATYIASSLQNILLYWFPASVSGVIFAVLQWIGGLFTIIGLGAAAAITVIANLSIGAVWVAGMLLITTWLSEGMLMAQPFVDQALEKGMVGNVCPKVGIIVFLAEQAEPVWEPFAYGFNLFVVEATERLLATGPQDFFLELWGLVVELVTVDMLNIFKGLAADVGITRRRAGREASVYGPDDSFADPWQEQFWEDHRRGLRTAARGSDAASAQLLADIISALKTFWKIVVLVADVIYTLFISAFMFLIKITHFADVFGVILDVLGVIQFPLKGIMWLLDEIFSIFKSFLGMLKLGEFIDKIIGFLSDLKNIVIKLPRILIPRIRFKTPRVRIAKIARKVIRLRSIGLTIPSFRLPKLPKLRPLARLGFFDVFMGPVQTISSLYAEAYKRLKGVIVFAIKAAGTIISTGKKVADLDLGGVLNGITGDFDELVEFAVGLYQGSSALLPSAVGDAVASITSVVAKAEAILSVLGRDEMTTPLPPGTTRDVYGLRRLHPRQTPLYAAMTTATASSHYSGNRATTPARGGPGKRSVSQGPRPPPMHTPPHPYHHSGSLFGIPNTFSSRSDGASDASLAHRIVTNDNSAAPRMGTFAATAAARKDKAFRGEDPVLVNGNSARAVRVTAHEDPSPMGDVPQYMRLQAYTGVSDSEVLAVKFARALESRRRSTGRAARSTRIQRGVRVSSTAGPGVIDQLRDAEMLMAATRAFATGTPPQGHCYDADELARKAPTVVSVCHGGLLPPCYTCSLTGILMNDTSIQHRAMLIRAFAPPDVLCADDIMRRRGFEDTIVAFLESIAGAFLSQRSLAKQQDDPELYLHTGSLFTVPPSPALLEAIDRLQTASFFDLPGVFADMLVQRAEDVRNLTTVVASDFTHPDFVSAKLAALRGSLMPSIGDVLVLLMRRGIGYTKYYFVCDYDPRNRSDSAPQWSPACVRYILIPEKFIIAVWGRKIQAATCAGLQSPALPPNSCIQKNRMGDIQTFYFLATWAAPGWTDSFHKTIDVVMSWVARPSVYQNASTEWRRLYHYSNYNKYCTTVSIFSAVTVVVLFVFFAGGLAGMAIFVVLILLVFLGMWRPRNPSDVQTDANQKEIRGVNARLDALSLRVDAMS